MKEEEKKSSIHFQSMFIIHINIVIHIYVFDGLDACGGNKNRNKNNLACLVVCKCACCMRVRVALYGNVERKQNKKEEKESASVCAHEGQWRSWLIVSPHFVLCMHVDDQKCLK